jgi:hypothetical protein
MNESTTSAEVLNGSGLSLSKAARCFPSFREDKPVAASTVFRWIFAGVRLPDGSRVRLEAVRLGGRWLTSREAIQRFMEAQTPTFGDSAAPKPRTTKQRESAADRAGKELTAIGI